MTLKYYNTIYQGIFISAIKYKLQITILSCEICILDTYIGNTAHHSNIQEQNRNSKK